MRMSKAKQNYANVSRWTKCGNIFDKTVHVFPINEVKSHWYLIVAIFPSVPNEFEPYMAVLDSIGKHDKQFAVEQIKNYLVEEIECKAITSLSRKSVEAMKTRYPDLPQQPDGSSCGVYLVYYFKQILRKLQDDVESSLSFLFNNTSSWFNDHILNHLRYDFYLLINNAAKEQQLAKLTLPDLQVFPTAAEDKATKRNYAQRQKANTPEDVMKEEKKPIEKTVGGMSFSKKRHKMSFQEYVQNVEETQQDYTSLWSYGYDGND